MHFIKFLVCFYLHISIKQIELLVNIKIVINFEIFINSTDNSMSSFTTKTSHAVKMILFLKYNSDYHHML